MRLLIAYATTDGQTRKIAQRAADTCMDQGHSVELIPAGEADGLDLSRFNAAILAGSVHINSYQKTLTNFVASHAGLLNTMPTLFLSVSLSAAGQDDGDWQGLSKILADFSEATGWYPSKAEQVAGAFMFSKYDVFRAWAMRRIAAKQAPEIKGDHDHEYTDWHALERTLAEWLASLAK